MAQTTCLASFGPVPIVATLHVVYLVVNNLYTLVSIYKTWKKKKNTYFWPKWTRLTLFGPILAIPTLHVPNFEVYNLDTLVSNYEHQRKKKENILMARSRHRDPPHRIFSSQQPKYTS